MVILSTALGAAIGLVGSVPGTGEAIGRDGFRVTLSQYGVLTTVPEGGLRTVDGPRMVFREGFNEWYGVSFDAGDVHFEACGPGSAEDWGDRPLVRFVHFEARGDRALAVARLGDLEVRTDLWIVEAGPYLVAEVTLSNTGTRVLRNVLYTREGVTGRGDDVGWTFPPDMGGLPPGPADLMRRAWMLDSLGPGASSGVGFSYTVLQAPEVGSGRGGTGGIDVPLEFWRNADWPNGLPMGATSGVSWGDYDADGFIDIFSLRSARLWRNVDGMTWVPAADLDVVLPSTSNRYGSSFGDYNNDGLPDIATAPRACAEGDTCMHLLRNLGDGPNFEDVATDPDIMDVQPCAADAETICWADVDDDGDLDLFFPAYPEWAEFGCGATGNFFFRNGGPVGPEGAYVLEEFTEAGGFENPPPDSARPEGAQFCDVDADGDLDLYSNGTLYQNVSTIGVPRVEAMRVPGSGIALSDQLDEGAVFGDYDLDGDDDLFIVYSRTTLGVKIWENRGDGTFFEVEAGVVESPFIGLNLGLSAADWDNDGDIDFTTRQVFRRNMLAETGERRFIVATTTIIERHRTHATPAWGDWDRDGDLDCALGNWSRSGHFYENTTYGPATPASERRYVRVRPLVDSVDVPTGLETAYGAAVEIRVAGPPDGLRRRKFTSSSAGYVNQNEYTLTFAMPDDPLPEDPDEDVRFDVVVDFPSLPQDGIWRVDRHVNPALGDLALADLEDREIVVFRSGRVVIDGTIRSPRTGESPRLSTTTGGLVVADPDFGLPDPVAVPEDAYAGIDFDTIDAPWPVRIREILVDGELGPIVACGDLRGAILLWDVTDPARPELVPSGVLDVASSARNDRSSYAANIVLERERRYRLVTTAVRIRATPSQLPDEREGVTVHGGLAYLDAEPCGGLGVVDATLQTDEVYIGFRFAAIATDADIDGDGMVGTSDLIIVLKAWGDCPDPPEACPADLDGDATVATSDLLIVLASWG